MKVTKGYTVSGMIHSLVAILEVLSSSICTMAVYWWSCPLHKNLYTQVLINLFCCIVRDHWDQLVVNTNALHEQTKKIAALQQTQMVSISTGNVSEVEHLLFNCHILLTFLEFYKHKYRGSFICGNGCFLAALNNDNLLLLLTFSGVTHFKCQ